MDTTRALLEVRFAEPLARRRIKLWKTFRALAYGQPRKYRISYDDERVEGLAPTFKLERRRHEWPFDEWDLVCRSPMIEIR